MLCPRTGTACTVSSRVHDVDYEASRDDIIFYDF